MKQKNKRNAVNSTFLPFLTNAADRNRTGTGITTHGILSPGRLPVPPLRHNKINRMGDGGFEPPKALPADLQSVPFGHSGNPPDIRVFDWSWWTDSNPRPADYKSAALPAELYQHLSNEQIVYYQTSIRLSTGNLKKGGILLYAGKRHHDSVHAVCSLCAQDIYAGETLWYRNGVTVCADCFPRFAREALRSFEYISGEASTL